MAYLVRVDDNYHYQDDAERYTKGTFATADEAIAAAKKIVDDYLDSAHKEGMKADSLLSSCKMFGEDPFIIATAPDEAVEFSAWKYAEARCKALCG